MPNTKASILAIDDDQAILDMYRDALSAQYQITTASDWLQGVDLILGGSFDLLILDLRMSLFDAPEFIRKIRTDRIPLVILVSSAYPNLLERVAGLGVDAVLAKPFTIDELETAVSRLLEKVPRRDKRSRA